MAHRIEGVSEKLEYCAAAEVLSLGDCKVSLRTIAKRAHTPQICYTRYGDKAGFFKDPCGETIGA